MNLKIISESNRRIPRSRIKELVSLIDDEEEPPLSTVNIVFIRDTRMKKLNQQFRNIPKSTDVLSFNIDDEPGPNNIYGEIYISTDTAAKNAVEYGFGFYQEILRLTCHGYLHLLGYDHVKKTDREKMEAREHHYLSKVGI